jgi:F-type H+-transporting ATPase subunit alpha
LGSIAVNKVRDFEKEYLEKLEQNHPETLSALAKGDIGDEVTKVLEEVGAEVVKNYQA